MKKEARRLEKLCRGLRDAATAAASMSRAAENRDEEVQQVLRQADDRVRAAIEGFRVDMELKIRQLQEDVLRLTEECVKLGKRIDAKRAVRRKATNAS